MRSMPAYRYRGRHRACTSLDDGFALIEVLVSMMIFAIIASAATYAVTSGIGSSDASRDRVGSANVAQQQLEQARAMPQASLVATPTATSTAVVGTGTYTVTRTVGFLPADSTGCPTDVATDAPHEITVHVEVAPANGDSRTVGMDTVIAC
jgi:prepilin-type N-terminal cleavage/methylation domain-containing protein